MRVGEIRAQHIVERKWVWESLYPQTGHGKTEGKKGPGRGGKRSRTESKEGTVSFLLSNETDMPEPVSIRAFVE